MWPLCTCITKLVYHCSLFLYVLVPSTSTTSTTVLKGEFEVEVRAFFIPMLVVADIWVENRVALVFLLFTNVVTSTLSSKIRAR